MPIEGADLSVVERRITAVTSVRQVLQLIWLLARSQLPEVERTASGAAEYVEWIDATLRRLAGPPADVTAHPEALHVVFGPERGYCGALVRNVMTRLPARGRLGLVGEILARRAAAAPDVASRVIFQLPGAVTALDCESVAHDVAEALLTHARDEAVVVHYPTLDAALHGALLFGGARTPVLQAPPCLASAARVLDGVLRELVNGRLAVAAIETLRSEVRARVAAAERARKGCDQRLEELTAEHRLARQSQITSELLEVVAGHLATPRP